MILFKWPKKLSRHFETRYSFVCLQIRKRLQEPMEIVWCDCVLLLLSFSGILVSTVNNTFSNITLFSIPLISLAWAVWWLFGTEPNWLVGFATLLRQRLHLVAELNYGLCTMSFIYQETVHKTNIIVYLNNVAAVQHILFRDIDGMFWRRSVSGTMVYKVSPPLQIFINVVAPYFQYIWYCQSMGL